MKYSGTQKIIPVASICVDLQVGKLLKQEN